MELKAAVIGLLAASLTKVVSTDPSGLKLTLTTSKDLNEIYHGDDLELECFLTGESDSDDYPIKWTRNGIQYPWSDFTSSDTSLKSIIQIKNITPVDEGNYTCYMQTAPYLSQTAIVKINRTSPGPKIYFSKGGSSTPLSGEVEIVCEASQQTVMQFRQMNGSLMDMARYQSVFNDQLMKTRDALRLTIPSVRVAQSGNYFCVNQKSGKSEKLSLQVTGVSLDCDKGEVDVEYPMVVELACFVRSVEQIDEINWKVKRPGARSFSAVLYDSRPHPQFSIITTTLSDDITTKASLRMQVVGKQDQNTLLKLSVGYNNQDLYHVFKINYDPKDPCGGCSITMNCDRKLEICICKGKLQPHPELPICEAESTTLVHSTTEDDDEEDDDDSHEESRGNKGWPDDQRQDKVIVVHKTSVGIILGPLFGVLGLILIIVIAYIIYRRRRKAKKNLQSTIDPNYLYQYEYHSEADMHKNNPSFMNPAYQLPPKKLSLRKENTYIDVERTKLEFPRERLQLGVDLGEGRFGKVIQARAMNITGNGEWLRVAVKTSREMATDAEKQDLFQELEIMRKLPNHINVVSLHGCCSKTDPLYIILEYAHRGSLLDYLRKCRPSSIRSRDSGMSSASAMSTGSGMTRGSALSRGSTLSGGSTMSGISRASTTSSFMQPRAKDLTIFALQIARGMAHVASCGIIHRDLASRNILLATDFTCKVCDFGLARDVEGVDVYERTSKGPLPIRWMSPEALADNMYTRKSDVWSYGVTLWEIVTLGATPYTGMSAMDVMRSVIQGQHLQRPIHCKEEMYDLMDICWEKPDERPTFAQIVTHLEQLMDDDYIVLSDYEESEYGWLDSYNTDERV